MEGSYLKWRAVIAGRGEQLQVKGRDLRQKGAISSGWGQSHVEERDQSWEEGAMMLSNLR